MEIPSDLLHDSLFNGSVRNGWFCARRSDRDGTMSQPASTLLRVENVTKVYGRRRVVDGISLEVHRGTVVGLLGRNGAGKTTTFRMVIGLVRPNGGSIDITNRVMDHAIPIGCGGDDALLSVADTERPILARSV